MAGKDKDDRGTRPRVYTFDQDKFQDWLETLDTDELTDPQRCGHILEYFKQHKVIKHVSFRPEDQYVRDKNAAVTGSGGSIDMSGMEGKGGI